jgi:4-hydroxybenzoate polyprenyltransferase
VGAAVRSGRHAAILLTEIQQSPSATVRGAVNVEAVPLCLRFGGTLTPVNLRDEHALGAIKRTTVDIGTLPVRNELLDWIRTQRVGGRRVLLVDDGDAELTQRVAAHLGVFDEVATVQGTGTLAQRTRRALVERFGEHGFDYIGGGKDELPVWAASRRAIVVGDRRLEERVARSTQVERVFGSPKPSLRTWVKAVRLHQWIKNALVFLPALLAHRIMAPAVLLNAVLAFLAFGCCASSVYITNDLFDLGADRQHRRKRHRPFAAGLLSVRSGIQSSLILIVCGALLAIYVGWMFTLVLAAYYVVTWAYSLRLKHVALFDVMTLAGLYTLRIIAGAAATRVDLSFWLLAFSAFIFLSLGFVKRYSEIYDAQKASKDGHARDYSATDLAVIMSLGTASGYCAVVVIALYINSSDSIALYHHHKPLWLLCPLMLFWISRVWMLTARGHMHDDPVVFALRDKISLAVVALMAVIVLCSI